MNAWRVEDLEREVRSLQADVRRMREEMDELHRLVSWATGGKKR